MKLIDANKLYFDCTTIWGYPAVGKNQIENAPTVSAVLIPEGATNGDMIKALFPCLEKYEYEEPYTHGIALAGNDNRVTWFANEWWNAPYKRGETE